MRLVVYKCHETLNVMNEIDNTLKLAQGISDFGFMVMVCAVFLVLCISMMFAIFRWFRTLIEKVMTDFSGQLTELQETARKNTEAMIDIAEGLIPETQLRIKNISGVFFDLAVEKVCRIIKKVREENHIADHEATAVKIRTLLTNLYEDRNSRFDSFQYHGKYLSSYTNPQWIEMVAQAVEAEIYNEAGSNNGRAYTNISAVYEKIKLDFYHRLNNK